MENDMYSIELSKISLDEFEEILTSVDLLPGRRILLNELDGILERLKQNGISDLESLRKLLQNKKQYPGLAETLSVSMDILLVLNREINGYVSKPKSLSELELFSSAELEKLQNAGIRSTKDLYEQCSPKIARQELSARLSLPAEQMRAALELSDLLRINGVGPVFARFLRELGIKSVSDYESQDSAEILENYQKVNEEKQTTKARLGLKDVAYCKRFCKKLDRDIEW
jgi:predicted flap endonuclease-1-like 5' DNA nuclease